MKKIKADERWRNWFTVNEITQNKFVSENQQQQNIAQQTIRQQTKSARELAKASKAPSASEQRESENESSGLDPRRTNKHSIKKMCRELKHSPKQARVHKKSTITLQ